MKKVFLKVISGVSMFMFTVGFATHAFMAANNIELTKPKTAYAMTTDADTVINHAREYIGYSNYDITSMGDKYLCSSAWCASFVTLILSETNVPNGVPDFYPDGIRPDIRVDEYVKYYMDEGRFHLNQSASSEGFTTANDEYISHEALEACRDGYYPKKGDLIIFDWGDGYSRKDGNPDHIAFFVSCENNRLITVEGNPGSAEWDETRVSELDNDFNYYNEHFIFGYITPHYSEETIDERIEREELEAKEREEANIQSIAESAASLGGNALETFFESISNDTFKVTFDAGNLGYVEKTETTVFRNACPINDFPPASPYDDSLTFYRWVDYYGTEYTKDSFYEKNITLFAEYTDNEGIIINPHYYEDSNNNWAMNSSSFNLGYWGGYPNYGTKEIDVEAKTYNKPNYYEPKTENSVTPEETTTKLGDVNGDGYINAVDSSVILQYTAQLATSGMTLSQEELLVMDADHDSKVTSNDSRLVLSYYTYVAVGSDTDKMTFKEFLANN